MSRENIEVVRRFYEVLNEVTGAYTSDLGGAENAPGVEKVLDLLDPDAEWDWPFTPDVFRGRDEWLRAATDWLDAVDNWQLQVDELIDAGDRVLLVLRILAEGKGSGAPVSQRLFSVVTVRDSRILRVKDYTERAEALEAVGLREQTLSRENVEVARRAYETFNARDISGWLATSTADADLHELPSIPDATVHRGHDEMRKWAEGRFETAEYGRFELQRFIQAGEFVVVPVRISSKGRVSGVPTEMRVFHVFEFSEGKIRRLWNYASEDEALEAVGLRE